MRTNKGLIIGLVATGMAVGAAITFFTSTKRGRKKIKRWRARGKKFIGKAEEMVREAKEKFNDIKEEYASEVNDRGADN